MALIVVETLSPQPITDEMLNESAERVLPCLEARDAHWQYSLLSRDRMRMICTFTAPDIEAVRSSYRRGNATFSQMWASEMHTVSVPIPQWNESLLTVFESTYPENAYSKSSGQDESTGQDKSIEIKNNSWESIQPQLLSYYAAHGAEWIRSYRSRDRTRLICELNAPDADVILQGNHQFGIPTDRVWSAVVLKP